MEQKNGLHIKEDLSMFELKGLRTMCLVVGFYTLFIVLMLPQLYLFLVESGQWEMWYVFLWRSVLADYLWAILTLPIFWLGLRFPLERGRLSKHLLLHLIFGLFFSALQSVAFTIIARLTSGASWAEIHNQLFTSGARFLNSVTSNFIYYVGALAVSVAANYARKYRDGEFQRQESELQALKTQLHPHFLFNTLNAIAALVYVSPPKAIRTVAELSDLLRLTIHYNKAHEVVLKEELDFLRKYVQIQQTLLGDRLEVVWNIEPATLEAFVPNMLLQPLVENAIRHGIGPKEEGGRVEVSTRKDNGNLLLEILDDGLGDADVANDGEGIGLSNSRARLEHLYGAGHSFDSGRGAEGGWRVSIVIPFRDDTTTA